MVAARTFAIWAALALAFIVPLVAATFSEQLQYRQPIYIASSFAAIAALGLLLVQPLLAGNYLPRLKPMAARKFHRMSGAALVILIMAHIGGLWITSPPDVIDALLFRSPTPFSLWGVIAMWAAFVTTSIVIFRRKLKLHPRTWRYVHMALAVIIAGCTIAHALQIDGTMEFYSKIALCVFVGLATAMMARKVYWSAK